MSINILKARLWKNISIYNLWWVQLLWFPKLYCIVELALVFAEPSFRTPYLCFPYNQKPNNGTR